MTVRPTITITLTDAGHAVPCNRRVAQLLKLALRAFNLRCIDVREVASAVSIPATDADVGTDAPNASPCEPRAPRGIVARAISAGHGRETNH